MIRYAYICNQVLQLYRSLPSISFPMNPRLFFNQIENCRIMPYSTFAKINSCSLDEVFALCESESGCTHYDITNDRYLVLVNSSTANNNVIGRIRWTLAHELGHVKLNHLPYLAEHGSQKTTLITFLILNWREKQTTLPPSCFVLCLYMTSFVFSQHRMFSVSLGCHGRLLMCVGENISSGNVVTEKQLGKMI